MSETPVTARDVAAPTTARGAAPKRIQRKRTKGWRMPQGAVYVGRPSRWGNPFRFTDYTAYRSHFADGELNDDPQRASDAERRRWAVVDFRAALVDNIGSLRGYPSAQEIRAELAGRDLACWCPLEDAQGNRVPCHADVLLEIANAPR